MSLLKEIQAALVQEGSEIGPILLKLRFLASRLGSNVLEEWIKHESEGYPIGVELPDYRLIPVSYTGCFSGPFGSGIRNAPIPPYLIEKFAGKNWVNHPVRESIAAVDGLLSQDISKSSLQINAANLILLLQGNIYEDMACNSITGTMSRSSFKELQYSVRTKILELTLKLEKEIPAATEIALGPMQENTGVDPEKVSQLSKQIIYGNMTTIHSTGDGAQISVNIEHGDIDALAKALVDGGIDQRDAREISEIISSEQPEDTSEPFGKKAKQWLGKNLVKAANGTWNVGVSVATKLFTEAALKYYGLK